MRQAAKLSTDAVLGAAGCGLATVSAAFGLYMVVHGPPPGSLGASKDFTVFAQLGPRRLAAPKAAPGVSAAALAEDDLDLEATASIPRLGGPRGGVRGEEATVLPSFAVRSAEGDEATIVTGGRAMVVRVGDVVPGAGEVLTITLGARPEVTTSRGRIVTSRAD